MQEDVKRVDVIEEEMEIEADEPLRRPLKGEAEAETRVLFLSRLQM